MFQELEGLVSKIEVNYRTQGCKESWENYYKEVEKIKNYIFKSIKEELQIQEIQQEWENNKKKILIISNKGSV